ncbi:MAG: chromosome segregation protein SMC [Anaerolineaceae bacterium]|nr:chromosome segregation protein SMC [Anaerolineaceae bacterium]
MTLANHLTSLELQGYKTFSSKTDFKFPAQLTAIVGPNGSGKSNIADAVRWVLGEQAYSLLRGKKTVDMIFSGSEQRPRASMAAVSITFNNESGWLPIDFTEVKIMRRAYRNGENEYLINNQRVRLKEINELLSSSGLAERNYTIIGQGLVDSALSLKPEDRRSFFEEAAGIKLYRSRRNEANQKLDKTFRNVERVNDILNELRPRIHSLEKQRDKVKKYLQIDADLKLLLKDWYGYHWHHTQKALKQAVAFNVEQQKNLDSCREVQQKLESDLKNAQESLKRKRKKLADLQFILSDLRVKKEENTRRLVVLEEREKTQKLRIQDLEKLWDEAKENGFLLKKEISEIISQSEKDYLFYETIKKNLNNSQESLQKRVEQRSENNTSIYNIESELNVQKQEELKLSALIDGLNHQISVQVSDAEQIKSFIARDQEDYKKVAEDLKDVESKIEKLERESESIKSTKLSLSKELDTIRNSIEQHSNRTSKLEHTLSKLKSDYSLLDEAEKALAGFSSGAKGIIDAYREGKLNGNFSLLLEHINVPEEYERAIAAALGAAIEGVVVNSDSEADIVLEYINKRNVPRTILVLNKKKQNQKSIRNFRGSYLIAADIVAGDKDAFPLIQNLLSHTLIVNDFYQAKELLLELPIGYQVVTKRGEILSTDYTITAGKELRARSFTRKRKKDAIRLEITKVENNYEEMKNSLLSLENRKQELQKQFSEQIKKSDELNSSLNELNLNLYKLEIEQEQRKKQLESKQARLDELQKEIGDEKADIELLAVKKHTLEVQIREKSEKIEKLYIGLKELPVEELRTKLIDLTSKYAVAEKIIESNKNRKEEKEHLLSAYQETIDQGLSRITEMREQLNEIAAESAKVKALHKNILERTDALIAKIKPIEKEVENEITNQSKFLEEVDNSRKKYAIAERLKMQSQMQVEKLKDKLAFYQKKIGEDFGIIIENDENDLYGPKPLPIEGIVASLPLIKELPKGLADQIAQKKALLRRIGPVNPNVREEYREVNNRYQFLSEQLNDLKDAEKDLRGIINELDTLMEKEFLKTFTQVEIEFEKIFTQLFNGGKAKLIIEDEENILDSGIEIEATLPGRRKQELALLSGGERSLTAVALIFALIKISPTPFCIMDEVDAMLDESNVMRFGELLRELSETTQLIIITHNRNTVQLADVIYGVTMGKDSVSQVISLKLDELTDEMVQ